MKEENAINSKINHFISLSIKNSKTVESGILLNIIDDWLLIKSIYSDYILDGYKIINQRYIKIINQGEEESFIENVLKASNKWNTYPIDIPTETNKLFHLLYEKEIVFEIKLKDGTVSYIGKIDRLLPKSFYFKPIGTRGVWIDDYKYFFRMDSVRIISLDTDYINSLLAYNRSLAAQYI